MHFQRKILWLFGVLLTLLLAACDRHCTPSFTWPVRNSGTSNWLYGVAYGGGLFVAVGQGGTLLTSP